MDGKGTCYLGSTLAISLQSKELISAVESLSRVCFEWRLTVFCSRGGEKRKANLWVGCRVIGIFCNSVEGGKEAVRLLRNVKPVFSKLLLCFTNTLYIYI